MSFLFTSTMVGSLLALVGVPILIHLINMMRHRKVKWAAMDFLLQSQKKHKKWVVLKQLLLLLLRMAAVAAIVMMIVRPEIRNEWSELLGGAEIHHIVLLDDSFSMSDRRTDSTAFERAKRVVARLAKQAGEEGGTHTFSVVRFSNASNLALGSQPDMIQENIDTGFSVKLEKLLAPMQPSETAAGPVEALEAVKRLPSKSDDENRVLYLVSDFRAAQWNDPAELRELLGEISEEKTQIHLVHCVDTVRPNLAVTGLKPHVGTRASGVELFMEVSVTNFGDETAHKVAIALEEDGHARAGLVIDQVAPEETITRRFPVTFPTAGEHTISATLPGDPVLIDNRRFAVVDMPDAVPVLIIDSDVESRDGYFLAAALNPGGKVKTGLRPRIETPAYLRKHEELASYHAIYLLNLERLDQPEIDALEDYVRSGGGVAFFPGELSRGKYYTEKLYRDGEGLFPAPLTFPTDLLAGQAERAPDLELTDHPIFKTFLDMRNNPLDSVLVERYFAVPTGWKPSPDSATKVIASLRNGVPFCVEKKFGDGHVVAFLTKASPLKTDLGSWNNWARSHSFPPAMLNLQGYLASGRQPEADRIVGQPLELEMDPNVYRTRVRFRRPSEEGSEELFVDAVADSEVLQASLPDTGQSGIYQAGLFTTDEKAEDRFFAYNVQNDEGDLHVLDGQQLAPRLEGLRYKFHRAEQLQYDSQDLAKSPLSDWILYLLLIVLVGEQLLAYSASYHPPRKGVAR